MKQELYGRDPNGCAMACDMVYLYLFDGSIAVTLKCYGYGYDKCLFFKLWNKCHYFIDCHAFSALVKFINHVIFARDSEVSKQRKSKEYTRRECDC